jgi:hypothetical protein
VTVSDLVEEPVGLAEFSPPSRRRRLAVGTALAAALLIGAVVVGFSLLSSSGGSGAPEGHPRIPHLPASVTQGGGAVWLGNADGTISEVDTRRAQVSAVLRVSPASPIVSTVFANGTLWALTDDQLFRIDPATGVVHMGVSIGSRNVAVAAAREFLWILDADGSVTKVSPVTNQAVDGPISSPITSPVGMVGNNLLWIMNRNTVCRVEVSNLTRCFQRIPVEGIQAYALTSGGFWAVADSGLQHIALDGRTDPPVRLTVPPEDPPVAVAASQDSVLVATRSGAVTRFDIAAGRLTVQNHQLGEGVVGIEIQHGRLWVGTTGSHVLVVDETDPASAPRRIVNGVPATTSPTPSSTASASPS